MLYVDKIFTRFLQTPRVPLAARPATAARVASSFSAAVKEPLAIMSARKPTEKKSVRYGFHHVLFFQFMQFNG